MVGDGIPDIFAEGTHMTKIESGRWKVAPGDNVFFVDFDGNMHTPGMDKDLKRARRAGKLSGCSEFIPGG
jgi:prephenate dehydratase